MATASTFFLHTDDNSPLTIPASLIPTNTIDTAHSNPDITDIRTTFLPIGGGNIRGAVQEGLAANSRAQAWGIFGEVFYHFYVANAGSVTLQTIGSTDTYMHLYNSSGTQLAIDDNSGATNNASITQALSTGWHFVKVRGSNSTKFGIFDVNITSAVAQTSWPVNSPYSTNNLILSWYDHATKLVYIAGQNEQSSTGSITVDKMEEVGKLSRGTFTATLKSVDSAGTSKSITNGYFNVVRAE